MTAGSFIYISCVDMLPEVIEESTKKKKFFLAFTGIFIGISFMYSLELLEPHIMEILKKIL